MLTAVSMTVVMLAFAGTATAQQWVDNATISPTTTLQPNRLCYTDGRDIACDGAAGLFITSGTLQFTKVSSTNISTTALTVNGVAITGSGGASALSGLSDVSASSPASGMLLRYNGSKWESVGASAALSTTTMVQNWPDAIVCNDTSTSARFILIQRIRDTAASSIDYYINGPSTVGISFNYPAQTYKGNSSMSTADCINKSIPQLYALGQAFNFIGGQYGGSTNQVIFHNGTQGVGDNNLQWVSGTATVSVTGTVSATNVSATSLQLNGASVTCGSGTLGVIRRSPTTGRLQVCQ